MSSCILVHDGTVQLPVAAQQQRVTLIMKSEAPLIIFFSILSPYCTIIFSFSKAKKLCQVVNIIHVISYVINWKFLLVFFYFNKHSQRDLCNSIVKFKTLNYSIHNFLPCVHILIMLLIVLNSHFTFSRPFMPFRPNQ